METTVTIQRTSKNIKAHFVASIVTGVVGGMMTSSDEPFIRCMGDVIMVSGFIWFFCTKIAKWWNHA